LSDLKTTLNGHRLRNDRPKELVIRHGSSGAKDKMQLDVNFDCGENAV